MARYMSDVISRTRLLIDDEDVPTNSQLVTMINEGRRQLVRETKCIEDIYAFPVVANRAKYTLSDSVLDIKRVEIMGKNKETILLPMTLNEWKGKNNNQTGDPAKYYHNDAKIVLWPRPVESAPTGTLISDYEPSGVTTTLSLDDVSLFGQHGYVEASGVYLTFEHRDETDLIDIEGGVMDSYDLPLLSGELVTQQNVEVTHTPNVSDLRYSEVNGTVIVDDTLERIFDIFPMILPYYAAWQAKLKDTDDVQAGAANAQANTFFMGYEIEKQKIINRVEGDTDAYHTIEQTSKY